MVKQAIVLCGGRGSRLGAITDRIPKPMVEVCRRPFVAYLVECLRNNGVEDVVLSVGYLKDQFSPLRGVRLVDCVPGNPSASVRQVPGLQEDFIVANGDVFPIMKWKEFMRCKSRTVAIKTHPELKDVGICIVKKEDLDKRVVDCGNIRGMISVYNQFVTSGNLHIGTPKGLSLAEEALRWWWRQ